MNQFNLYIGADNATGIVNKDKIIYYLTHTFSGFTIIDSIGLWEGKRESSVVVSIFTNKNRRFMIEFIKGLCAVLKQDCVVMQSMIAEKGNMDMKIDFLPPADMK